MGIVRRQTIKNNLLSYLGVAIGVVSQLYIYPLNLDAKGFADGLMKFATLLYPFFTLGVGAVMVRFVPYLKEERSRATVKLFSYSVAAVTVALTLLVATSFFFGEATLAFFAAQGIDLGLLISYRWSIIAILACLVYASLLSTNLINHSRIAVPVVFNNLILKLTLPALVLLWTYHYIAEKEFVTGLIASYLLIVVGLLLYSKYLGALGIDLSKFELKEKSVREMISTASYAVFGLLGSSLVTNMDVVMVNTTLTNLDTAIYSFALFAAGVMGIPYAAVNTITAPIVAKEYQAGNFGQLQVLYRDSSIALTAAGTFILTGLAVCLPYLYFITDNMTQHIPGYWPTLLIGVGILTDQVTGINSALINYTDHYRWHIVFVLLAGVLNYVLNYYFLVVLEAGIEGAAMATMLSLIFYNLAKSLFIYRSLGIQPLAFDHGRILLAFIVIGLLAWAIPALGNVWLEIIVRGGTIAVSAFLIFRYTRLSPFVRQTLREGLKSVF